MPCQHSFRLLESGVSSNGKRVWIFFCKKCLELKEVDKSPSYRYPSDRP